VENSEDVMLDSDSCNIYMENNTTENQTDNNPGEFSSGIDSKHYILSTRDSDGNLPENYLSPIRPQTEPTTQPIIPPHIDRSIFRRKPS